MSRVSVQKVDGVSYVRHDGGSDCELLGPFGHCSLRDSHFIHEARGGAGNVLGRWRLRVVEEKEVVVTQWE